MKKLHKQKGFTLTPALFVIVLLIMTASTFLIYIGTIGKTERKLESATIAKLAAETGLYHMKTELGRLAILGDLTENWDQATELNTSTLLFDVQGSPMSKTIKIRENINDSASKIIGEYIVTLEDGSLLSNGKTATGSSIQGMDRYNNQIWNNTSEQNKFTQAGYYRFGVRVDGYALNPSGNRLMGGQSVYAVMNVPISPEIMAEETGADSPSGYLLATDGLTPEDPTSPNNGKLYLFSNQLITGPVHSNEQVNFYWKGNFNILNNSSTTKQKLSSYNNKYTVFPTRFGGASDPPPPFINNIVKLSNQVGNAFTIYGDNFFLPTGQKIYISINNAAWIDVSTGVTPPRKIQYTPATALVAGNTVEVWSTYSAASTIYTVPASGVQTVSASSAEPNNANGDRGYLNRLKVYGIMQASKPLTLGETIYRPLTDYTLILYDDPATTQVTSGNYYEETMPYITWTSTGTKPAYNERYRVTYITENNIPHRRINVLGPVTYSGINTATNSPKEPQYFYEHSHKAHGTSSYSWTGDHSHGGNIFRIAVSLLTALNPSSYLKTGVLYDWDTPHLHEVQSTVSTISVNAEDDLFFFWKNSAYKPANVSRKKTPILAPNNVNYYTQREQVNQIFKMILDKELIRNSSGYLQDPAQIPEDRTKGYYVGSQDFRGVYFGNDLKYSAGSSINQSVLAADQPITATATVYVNDNPSSSDYLKVAKEAVNSNYKFYTYRQIPRNAPIATKIGTSDIRIFDGGIIFVRGGTVQLGARYYNGRNSSNRYANASSTFGSATIIDGRLTIFSYSETKPSTYVDLSVDATTDNPGDIIVTGDIIYKNKLIADSLRSQSNPNIDLVDNITQDLADKTLSVSSRFNGINQFDRTTNTQITVSDGSLQTSLPTNLKPQGLSLFASNDIKIPVGHYYQDSSEGTYDPLKVDRLTIHAQMIAGHQITQTKAGSSNNSSSKNDQLVMYGSYYSHIPPNMGYFDRENPDALETNFARLYLYDRTLDYVPLGGTPYFPKDNTYTPQSQYITGLNFPVIVPGSWRSIPVGS